jgi:hypothetical protein
VPGGFLSKALSLRREPRVPILPVCLNGKNATMRTVQLRTRALIPGVLCEVWAEEGMQLCLIERVNADGSFVARPLPAPPSVPYKRAI